jgi:hypothetical protein
MNLLLKLSGYRNPYITFDIFLIKVVSFTGFRTKKNLLKFDGFQTERKSLY